MADSGDFRLSDERRDQAAQELREHYAAGRLSEDELSERVQQVYSARTESELRALHGDLPKLPASPEQQRAELAQRRALLQRRLLQESGGAAVLFLICTVVWIASGAHGQFWPIWVGLVALIPLVRNGWRLYGPAPQLDQVEAELDSRGRRAGSREQAGDRLERRMDRLERRSAARDRRRGGGA